MTIGMGKILAAIAAAKAKREAEQQQATEQPEPPLPTTFYLADPNFAEAPDTTDTTDTTNANIVLHGKEYNKEQSEAIRRVAAGESICMIGAAGTGKTTGTHGMAHYLIDRGLGSIGASTKWLSHDAPGVVILSFTRRATANIKRQMPDDLKGNTLTFHKILEYRPVIYEEYDPAKGKLVKKRRFEPFRNRNNPLPAGIKVVIVEESSMLGLDLFMRFYEALPFPEKVQWVFLGDINQLPPFFGKSIFGYKLLELPVVELTQIYRQALESPGLRLAHAIKDGAIIPSELEKGRHVVPKEWHHPGKLTIRYWQREIQEDEALLTAYGFLKKGIEDGYYDPYADMVLLPFNKRFGSIELGNYIANYLGKQRGAVVHEVIAGFNKHYLAEGDKLLYDKEDCIIERITPNEGYMGVPAQLASIHMDRWGVVHQASDVSEIERKKALDTGPTDVTDIDFLLAQTDVEDRVHAASHTIVLRMPRMSGAAGGSKVAQSDDDDLDNDDDDARTVTISDAAEINKLISGHVMTVHKSQGCEWRRVFYFIHRSHSIMACREILYTGTTRFREELVMIVEPDRGTPGTKSFKAGTFRKGIESQQIPGSNLHEKLEHFREEQLKALSQLKNEEDKDEIAKLLFIIGDKIKARIKEQVEVHREAVEKAARDAWEKLVALDPAKRYIPRYQVDISVSFGDTAGTAQSKPGTSIITIDSTYLIKNPKECIERTVPHEVAHIANTCWNEGSGHDRGWKALMKELGFVPDKEIFHHMGSRQAALQTVAKGM